MIASSCFEASAPFDLQITTGVCNLGLAYDIIIVSFRWCSVTEWSAGTDNQVKSEDGASKLIANRTVLKTSVSHMPRLKKTRRTFSSSAVQLQELEGMHDYKLFIRLSDFITVDFLLTNPCLGGEDGDGKERILSHQDTKQKFRLGLRRPIRSGI